jgi:hypothetical protein
MTDFGGRDYSSKTPDSLDHIKRGHSVSIGRDKWHTEATHKRSRDSNENIQCGLTDHTITVLEMLADFIYRNSSA